MRQRVAIARTVLRRHAGRIHFDKAADGGVVAENGGGVNVAAGDLRVGGEDRLGRPQ